MQLQNEIVKKHTPIKSLLIDWLIIFGTYLFIRIFFALFGLHQNIVLLGCCLAILPYLFGALYLQKSHKQCQLWLAALAILIPSVVEKAAIYLFGAYLYNLRPINVVGVMEAIKSNAPYTNFIKNQSAQNLINLSYFNWTYILCSIAISVLVILLCNGVQREHNKKLNNGLPILHKVPPKRDYGRYFCIMAEKGGTSHGGLTEKLSPFFHAKKQEVNAYGR